MCSVVNPTGFFDKGAHSEMASRVEELLPGTSRVKDNLRKVDESAEE